MAPKSDHELGRQLAQLIQQSGELEANDGVISRRLPAQLQDLLGADTTLLTPLRDLLQRPAFRQLFNLGNHGQSLHARDALLRDLAEVYSSAVMGRLEAVLQGCFNLDTSASAAAWPAASSAGTNWPAPSSQNPQPSASSYGAPTPSQLAPIPASQQAVVVAVPQKQHGGIAILIGLLALICGALMVALVGVLIISRSKTITANAPAAPSQPSAPESSTPSTQPSAPTQQEPSAPAASGQWQACIDYSSYSGPPPQAGETWWPVVGPGGALQDARQHCRSDAFTNASGNVQIASFRDQDTAAAFAQQLTSDNSHPYSFWVGDPTTR